ncbi:MAG TPA: putative DNA modification/repair radical SAM protein [Veillonellaceae bacterium]|jgi:putative DNA modification/repair radical SAM protein|nr:putative DNA modification/repair radical SAM protein [Veillonellaceae bacterium]
MDIIEKLAVLADAAKYDVSCSSSGSRRQNHPAGLGNAAYSGICHSWSSDGRCISLLKILMTNQCQYDCEYCVNRRSHETVRAFLSPREIVHVTMEFYRRNYIEGLFLSSGIFRSPDDTMELMIETARILRTEMRFNGYIHMKAIPGCASSLIDRMGQYVDRMSVNMELPSETSLRLLAPQKNRNSILSPMKHIAGRLEEIRHERKLCRYGQSFVPAGQTTQMIVGASQESDRQILKLSEALYQRVHLKRVYYSAYVPVMKGKNLPVLRQPPLMRENRLYQADWLLRYYHFTADEILSADCPNFDPSLDPKICWALRHMEYFPVEVNSVPYKMLLRVPGIGVVSARRIAAARRGGMLQPDELKKLGVVWKRARYFITCGGIYEGAFQDNPDKLKVLLTDGAYSRDIYQMSLFGGQS